jgi:hypothetical protein
MVKKIYINKEKYRRERQVQLALEDAKSLKDLLDVLNKYYPD